MVCWFVAAGEKIKAQNVLEWWDKNAAAKRPFRIQLHFYQICLTVSQRPWYIFDKLRPIRSNGPCSVEVITMWIWLSTAKAADSLFLKLCFNTTQHAWVAMEKWLLCDVKKKQNDTKHMWWCHNLVKLEEILFIITSKRLNSWGHRRVKHQE